MQPKIYPKALFNLGYICGTPEALRAVAAEGADVIEFLKRHVSGDWGILSQDENRENERALAGGSPIVSAYILPHSHVKLVLITEANRSQTTFLLPTELGWRRYSSVADF